MKKWSVGCVLLQLCLLCVFVQLFAARALAIPAFARKYRTSCSTCHVAYPVLNSFGKAFKASGYRIPAGDEGFTKDEPVRLGGPPWKQGWPDSLLPSDLPCPS